MSGQRQACHHAMVFLFLSLNLSLSLSVSLSLSPSFFSDLLCLLLVTMPISLFPSQFLFFQ